MTDHDDDPLIGSAEVRRLLGGCHQITLYRKIKEDPRFPKPLRGVVSSRLAWRLSTIKNYVAEKERESAMVA